MLVILMEYQYKYTWCFPFLKPWLVHSELKEENARRIMHHRPGTCPRGRTSDWKEESKGSNLCSDEKDFLRTVEHTLRVFSNTIIKKYDNQKRKKKSPDQSANRTQGIYLDFWPKQQNTHTLS